MVCEYGPGKNRQYVAKSEGSKRPLQRIQIHTCADSELHRGHSFDASESLVDWQTAYVSANPRWLTRSKTESENFPPSMVTHRER